MHIYFLWHVKTEIFTGIKNIKKQTRNKANKLQQTLQTLKKAHTNKDTHLNADSS